MHAILFSLKRAYHGTLSVTRPALARLGLTPARFDLLYIVATWPLNSKRQSDLRRELGVTAPTVCRMLKSLEELGLVTRAREGRDTRQRFVALTRKGLWHFRRARSLGITSGASQLAVDSMVAGHRWFSEATT